MHCLPRAWLALSLVASLASLASGLRVVSPRTLPAHVPTPAWNYILGADTGDPLVPQDLDIRASLALLQDGVCDAHTTGALVSVDGLAGNVVLVKRPTNGGDAALIPTWRLDRTIMECVAYNGGVGLVRFGAETLLGMVYYQNHQRHGRTLPILEATEQSLQPIVDAVRAGANVTVDLVADPNEYLMMTKGPDFKQAMRVVVPALVAISIVASLAEYRCCCGRNKFAATNVAMICAPIGAALVLGGTLAGPFFSVPTAPVWPSTMVGIAVGFHHGFAFLPVLDGKGAGCWQIFGLILPMVMGFFLILLVPLITQSTNWSVSGRMVIGSLVFVSTFFQLFFCVGLVAALYKPWTRDITTAKDRKARQHAQTMRRMLKVMVLRVPFLLATFVGCCVTFAEAGPDQSPTSFLQEWNLILVGVAFDMVVAALMRMTRVCALVSRGLRGVRAQARRSALLSLHQELLEAVEGGDFDRAEAILDKAALDVDARDPSGNTVLHKACAKTGSLGVISKLLALGATTSVQNRSGVTPLMVAACANRPDSIERLLGTRCDPGAVDKQGNNALHHAALGNANDVANVLARALSEDSARHANDQGHTPAFLAVLEGHAKAAASILTHTKGNSHNAEGFTPFLLAVSLGKVDVVKALASVSPNDLHSVRKVNALHLACEDGRVDVVRALLATTFPRHVAVNGHTVLRRAFQGDFNAEITALLKDPHNIPLQSELAEYIGGGLESCPPVALCDFLSTLWAQDGDSWGHHYCVHISELAPMERDPSKFQALGASGFGQSLRTHLARYDDKQHTVANESIQAVRLFLDHVIEEASECTDVLLVVYQHRRNAHRRMYESVMLGVAQEGAFADFVAAAKRLEELTPEAHPRQTLADLPSIYARARDKEGQFNAFVALLCSKSGGTFLQAPLKGLFRSIEKVELRREGKGDATLLCDVVRGGVEFGNMYNMLMFLQLLASSDDHIGSDKLGGIDARAAGVHTGIKLLRVKNRFQDATSGGWRDCMVNFCFADDETRFVCEVQLVHARMMLVRKQMGAHTQYAEFRSALELLEATGHDGDIAEMEQAQEEKIQAELERQRAKNAGKARSGSVASAGSVGSGNLHRGSLLDNLDNIAEGDAEGDKGARGSVDAAGDSGEGSSEVVGALLTSMRTMEEDLNHILGDARTRLESARSRVGKVEKWAEGIERAREERRRRELEEQARPQARPFGL